ncbi:hypothetical protein PV327_007690 [Microctonus hyperodae]|uniref:Uncharacterized protein n=1 Tax=Microctonus hyperodae TaxID=165561 RepID=A0AA39KYZ4_MICHY|nr:hypothetical protein PV327_007690 [Microctonus hyperodae]
MYFIIFIGIWGLIVLSSAQDPRHAAILTDARYLAGDGTFGAAYTQEDGVQFKEVSDANGDRRGSYSYVDPTGHRRTVEYTAGKNGFQPIGEGIPKVTLPTPPPPGYEPLPEYNPPEYQSESEPQPRPPPRSYQYQTEPQYVRQSIYQPQTTPAPQAIYRPRYQNQYEVAEYQSQHVPRAAPRQQRILASYNPPQPPTPPPPSSAAVRPRYQLEPHYQAEAQYGPHIEYSFNTPSQAVYREYQPEYNDITTPSPHRYYPPGKLDFTRTPDGFSYTFTKS